MYVVIVGCGRAGSGLAARLSRRGVEVVVIDRDPSTLENLSPEFTGFAIEGDAIWVMCWVERCCTSFWVWSPLML